MDQMVIVSIRNMVPFGPITALLMIVALGSFIVGGAVLLLGGLFRSKSEREGLSKPEELALNVFIFLFLLAFVIGTLSLFLRPF